MLLIRLSLLPGELPEPGVRVTRAGAHSFSRPAQPSASGLRSHGRTSSTARDNTPRWSRRALAAHAMAAGAFSCACATRPPIISLATYKVGEPAPTTAAPCPAVNEGPPPPAKGRAYPTASRVPAFFTFRRAPLQPAFAGDTLASALLRQRPCTSMGRSFKYHKAPRWVSPGGCLKSPTRWWRCAATPRLTTPTCAPSQVDLYEGTRAHSHKSLARPPALRPSARQRSARPVHPRPAFLLKTFMVAAGARCGGSTSPRHFRAAAGLGHSPNDGDPDPVTGLALRALRRARRWARAPRRTSLPAPALRRERARRHAVR